jgi:uncharacterized membrane protein (GlpM family)
MPWKLRGKLHFIKGLNDLTPTIALVSFFKLGDETHNEYFFSTTPLPPIVLRIQTQLVKFH